VVVSGLGVGVRPVYSVVVPARDEALVLPVTVGRLVGLLDRLDGPGEVVFVDDGSGDASFEVMCGAAAADPRFRVVRLSRNFGHQVALTAGLDFACGDAVVAMDADLQDPPEVVLELAAKWREGFDVVYAVRDVRVGETRFKRATAALFYRAFNRISETKVPLDVGDFRLVDRRALDAFAGMRESNRFVRGMFSWVGLRQTGVLYRREARVAGETHYPLRKMLRFAVTGLISFSGAPLRLALRLGFGVSVVAFAYAVWSVVVRFAGFYHVPGWTSLVVVTALLGGIQLIILGVLGEYVADIHVEVKRRPLYVVDELVNVPVPDRFPERAVIAGRHTHHTA
jgi:glycosyltransferase involved in cell wall biosynthesis